MNIDAFTGRAKAYAEVRPGYPDEAVEYIKTLAPRDAVFADVGAGTGKFTKLLAEYDYKIFAVEPNSDMRGQLELTLAPFPNALIINGTAEATTLLDNSVDVITNAQALRRFDIKKFRAECKRIGKADPIIITVFNDGERFSTEYKTMDKVSEGYAKATGELYQNPDVRKFSNPIHFTRDKWLLYYSSMEGVPLEGEEGYESHTAELNDKFDRYNIDGIICLDLTTYVYSERINM